jgi:hypothetical protein
MEDENLCSEVSRAHSASLNLLSAAYTEEKMSGLTMYTDTHGHIQ